MKCGERVCPGVGAEQLCYGELKLPCDMMRMLDFTQDIETKTTIDRVRDVWQIEHQLRRRRQVVNKLATCTK
jgi:hypothetical protein